MHLGGLILNTPTKTASATLSKCAEDLQAILATMRDEIARFKEGLRPHNPVEGRSGTHTYTSKTRRMTASYYGPTFGYATLNIVSPSFDYEIQAPVPWNVDDSLEGLADLVHSQITAVVRFLAASNLESEASLPQTLGTDPLPWMAALATMCPTQKSLATLKTPSTPSHVEGHDDETAIQLFDSHCPAFLWVETGRTPADSRTYIGLYPLESDDDAHRLDELDPIRHMRAIADAVAIGAIKDPRA